MPLAAIIGKIRLQMPSLTTSRPLIISDCDEVLLHMVAPFRDWLDCERHIHFDFSTGDFAEALRHKLDGTVVLQPQVWELLNDFFDSEMDRQEPIAGAVEAINALQDYADIVILTNLLDHRADARSAQLRAVGIHAPVYTNQGGKGRKIAEIIAEYAPSMVVFIDDLANHHESAAHHTTGVWRVHFIGEPMLSEKLPPAPFAHARFDAWADALPWIMAKVNNGASAPKLDVENDQCTTPPQLTPNSPASA